MLLVELGPLYALAHQSPARHGIAVDILAPGLWHTADFAKEGY